MKLLLTGAHGFTGQHLCYAAQAAGYVVAKLSVDLQDQAAVKAQVLNIAPEYVAHLAGISFVGHTNVNAFYAVNVTGTLNLLEALSALKRPPRAVLLASSANVYGNCVHSPIRETQAPAPVNHYAMSKLAMEYLSRNYLPQLPLFWVRPFNYTGCGQADAFVIPKLVAHFAQRRSSIELGNIAVEREFNDVRFVCATYLKLLQQATKGEVYNICTQKPVALQTVITLLQQLSGHTLDINVNPAFIRSHEISRLCGHAEKLIQTIGSLEAPTLATTLTWMLENYQPA